MTALNSLQSTKIHLNLKPESLIQESLKLKRAEQSSSGALVIKTGKFTGRSPKDKFFVKNLNSETNIDWNDFNIPIGQEHYDLLKKDLLNYLDSKKEIWSRQVFAGATPEHQIQVQVYNEYPESNLFAHNMFIEPENYDNFKTEWTVFQAPDFKADPKIHGTRQENFSVISLEDKTILIGGTGYTGEMKKGVFTVVNYLLPIQKNILTMHCSANVGKNDDVAIFFGLSGTGKTTLSTDPQRALIGDDEHAWSETGVFNIEGGCYAKVVNLSKENEPQIFNAIRDFALIENTNFLENSNQIDFSCTKITENTRVSYPLEYIPNAKIPSEAGIPKNIFFLTCDAFGILPPISKLSKEQAMFYFLSGYTAKIAGTEEGITEPNPTFSTCFGAPFLPLNPRVYADMLGQKIEEGNVKIWMINTGWTGGAYGKGQRIKLKYTRAMINAALDGKLDKVIYQKDKIFKLEFPLSCPGVPSQILNPKQTWENKNIYSEESIKLAELFVKNFQKFSVSDQVKAAAPKI